MTVPTEILVVDDNPADSDLTRELLEQSRPSSSVRSVPNGLEAVAFLRQQGRYADMPRTQFVMLDLNMPVRDGPPYSLRRRGIRSCKKFPSRSLYLLAGRQ